MTTASEVRSRVLAAVQSSTVATAAAVATATWASTTVPHVFDGDRVSAGGRNRGRLPFVEVFIASQPFVPEGSDVGMVETEIRLRAHIGGAEPTTAYETAEAILTACFAAIRSDQYFNLGDSGIAGYATNPLWHRVDARLTVQHSYDPATFDGV